ncbi:methionyl-tRNA formyltransferase [Bombilactobacillus bombi]|uniref:Methionyl-tRNA formyltransferase n=1 Tax=Bombilactobacillus bombi TaxID=1303590 RepID=A0A417ZCA8_9LACO|nr:methionyl-tRNA formyltransferase [Bombilactobacillus bombi]RHW48327.1 methionyl-tRNA formyltransferase [Bombilactobacillus bombi]
MTKIIFMGTPEFAVPILDGLVQNDYEIVGVVTQPDRAVGRKQKISYSPVKKYAVQHNLPLYQPEKLAHSAELAELIALQADLIITAAFGQFLPTKLLQSAQIAPLNVHGSLLPRNRGGAPVQRAIMNGDLKTGITIMYMAAKMDAGDIIIQQAIDIKPTDTAGSLFEKLSIIGRDLLLASLPQVIAGTNKRVTQDESLVTITPNISPEEEQIDISQPAIVINRQVRGLNPDPGAYLFLNEVRTKVFQTSVGEQTTDLLPGQVVVKTKKQLAIAAGKQTVIYLEQIQPAGKAVMPITAFLNGKGKDIQVGEQIIK